jgi:hypothetical protein
VANWLAVAAGEIAGTISSPPGRYRYDFEVSLTSAMNSATSPPPLRRVSSQVVMPSTAWRIDDLQQRSRLSRLSFLVLSGFVLMYGDAVQPAFGQDDIVLIVAS